MTFSVDKAIKLAEDCGWRVFPANPENKRPLISGWQDKAAADPKEIKKLFRPFPNAMIGLPTGPINGITVIDLDIKNNVDGFRSIMSLGIPMPTFAIASTPTGGLHLYYSTHGDEHPCSAGKIGRGVDVRGAGGYVIAPGSVALSGQYQWKNDLHKTKYGMLPFTVDLTNAIHGHKPKRSSAKGQCSKGQCSNILNPVDGGQRNVEMTRRCGLLFHKGYTPSEVEGMLIRINNKCCRPPLGDREILGIFRSIAKREGK